MTTLLASAPSVNTTSADAITFGETTVSLADYGMMVAEQLISAGVDHTAQGERDALMEVYRDDPSLFAEDVAKFRADHPAPAPTPSAKSAKPDKLSKVATALDGKANKVAAAKVDYNEKVIADIVGMIRAKYTEEGLRSFAIGKRAFEHAQWQKGNFPGEYTHADFTNLMGKIRDEVRVYVHIKPQSIRVADWSRCHVLRECVRTDAGDAVAESLSMYEYLAIVGKALHFDARSLEGSVNPCWLDMVKGVAIDRAKDGGRVTTEQFENRIAETIKRSAAAKLAALDPAQAAAKVASDAMKAKTAAVAKTAKGIADSVNDGIASGTISPEGALAILEDVAKHHGKPLQAASVGFDPVNCTVSDCDVLIATMYSANKLTELRRLIEKASAAVAQMESACKAASKAGDADAVAKIG